MEHIARKVNVASCSPPNLFLVSRI
jgi:hypothetical protein